MSSNDVCAGLESLKLGRGGDRQLSDFLGRAPHTVARGRQQLLAQDVEVDRVRRTGGGRKPWAKPPHRHTPKTVALHTVEKKIIEAIEILLEHDTAGDPITGLKWTRKTTEKIAEVLQQIDIPVSAKTVARLLYQMDFSLRVNRKQIATNSSPTAISNSSISARCGLASSDKVFRSSASIARNAN